MSHGVRVVSQRLGVAVFTVSFRRVSTYFAPFQSSKELKKSWLVLEAGIGIVRSKYSHQSAEWSGTVGILS